MRLRLALFTSLGLLLAACAQSAPPVASTMPPSQSSPRSTVKASSSLYELSVQGVGAGKLSASVRQVGSGPNNSGLSPQGLVDAPSGLSFKLLSASTFTVNSSGVRHVRVTYQVTNTTGSALTNLSFLPVNTDEDSAGPSNNGTSVPTVGNTPYKDVTYFDGSDASGKAASLTPVAGKQFNASAGAAESDPNASAFLTGLDTTGLNATPPAGLIVADIKPLGWRVAPSLPAGASANVTLAVDLPLDPAGSAKDPFNFTLVFTSAQDSTLPSGTTAIHSLQGATPSGDAPSPLLGQTVTIQGIVTAVYRGAGELGGFFVQAPDAQADSDPATSEGVFVFCNAVCPAASEVDAPRVGDELRLSGTVAEFGTPAAATQLSTLTTVQLLNRVQPLPTPLPLAFPLSSRSVLERYEGMRITVPGNLTVTSNFGLGRFGQLTLSSGGRVFNPTNGQGGDMASNTLRLLTIDDGVTSQNPATLPFLNGTDAVTATRRTGDTVADLSGVLNWFSPSSDYLLYPSTPPAFVNANPRPAAPAAVGGTLRVAGANVLNYFTDLVTSNAGCETSNGQASTSRGANTCAEFVRQQTKIVQALRGLDADVVTLMEVQNNGEAALNSLRDALNAAYGSAVYSAVASGKLGTDAIKVAMLYKSAKVTPLGSFLTENPQSGGEAVYSRPPLAQTFTQIAGGGTFSVIANHFKSKGSCPAAGTDAPNQDSGQGCWNAKRVAQSQALLGFVNTVKVASGDADVLVMGDLNAYGEEDPITTLTAGGFEGLNKRIPAQDRYSYQFGGAFGYLDHALSSSSLSAQVSGITEWHINADEPTVLDYNTEFKVNPACTAASCTGPDLNNVPGTPTPYRASDHDPVLVGLSLTANAAPAPALSLSAAPAALTLIQDTSGSVSVTVNASGSSAPVSLAATVSGSGTIPTVSLSPASVSGSASSTSTAVVQVPAGVPVGSYPVSVTGTGEAGTQTTSFTVNVTSAAPQGKLVISQVYGGGGNTGARYKNDFVELFNAGKSDVNTAGLSVQYANTSGAFTQSNVFALPGATVLPGRYFLVQLSAGAGGTDILPSPDAAGNLNLSGTGGKVALARITTPVTGSGDSANLLDFVGWGAATSFEGSAAAPATSNTTSVQRLNSGCQDSDLNSADFSAAAPVPRSSASPANVCP